MSQSDKEQKIFKDWFLKYWISAENEMSTYWLEIYKQLLEKEKLTSEEKQTQQLFFNDFLKAIWPKYAQIALYHLASKIKEKPLNLNEGIFEKLPFTAIKNWEDFSLH